MRSVLNEVDRQALDRRVASLTAGAAGRWGRLTVGAMLGHLCQSARMASGELQVKPGGKRAFQVFPLKHLLLYVVPFPKGAPTAPELLAAEPGAFDHDRAQLRELLAGLGRGPQEGPGPIHPLFGPLSRQAWGVLVYKHTDHHLRQFGA